jgi:hypothetical protein
MVAIPFSPGFVAVGIKPDFVWHIGPMIETDH